MLDDDIGVSCGDKGLVAAEVLRQRFSAGAVELGEDVVEEQEGGYGAGLLQALQLYDLKRQNERACLTARCCLAGWATIEQYFEILAVGTNGREAAQDIAVMVGFEIM